MTTTEIRRHHFTVGNNNNNNNNGRLTVCFEWETKTIKLRKKMYFILLQRHSDLTMNINEKIISPESEWKCCDCECVDNQCQWQSLFVALVLLHIRFVDGQCYGHHSFHLKRIIKSPAFNRYHFACEQINRFVIRIILVYTIETHFKSRTFLSYFYDVESERKNEVKLFRVTTAVNRRCCHKSTLAKDITHAARIDIEHELPSERNIKEKKYCEEINQNQKVKREKRE